MGCLTAKASGEIASFINPTVTPIESARVYFSPTQLGEGTPSPENVREIVGRTSVELYQCGKNLFDKSQCVNNYRLKTDGTNYSSNDYYISSFIPVKVGNVYVKNSPSIDAYHRFCTYSNADATSFIRKVDNSNSITIASNERYIRFCGEITEKDTAQLELGSTATPYQPYQGKTIPFSWKRLPDEYQEVEWIESTGTQAILTDIPCQLPLKTDIDVLFTQSNDSYFCGTRYGDVRICSGGNYQNNVQWAFGTYKLTNGIVLNTRYLLSTFLDNGNQSIAIDSDVVGTYEYTLSESEVTSMNGNLALFAVWINNSQTFGQYAKAKCYAVKISNNNALLGNFIPCYRKSDNEIGMYDTVSQTFYTNQGTGTFTKGNDVFSDEVYGGYVDLVKGEIVETHYGYIVDGINIKTNSRYKKDSNDIFGAGIVYNSPIGKGANTSRYPTNILCNKLPVSATDDTYSIPFTYAPTAGNLYTVFYIAKISEHPEITTNNEMIAFTNAWLQENPVQLVYELKTTITHPLPDYLKTQLQTLKNENTFWSDADSVEIDYGLAETFDIQKAKRKIIMNQPHVESITGDAISFTTDMKAPLKECKVSFMPVQEGSGDPSPSNVRNITGWNGVSVTRCKKNLIIEDDPLNPNANYGHNSTGTTKYSEEEQAFYDQTPGVCYAAHATGKSGLSYDNVKLFIAPSDMTVVFSVEYKNVGTTYGIRLHKNSSRLTDIHGNADSTWHRYSQVISLSKGDYLKLIIYDKIYWRNIQVEIANSVTDYEPYQGTTYSIDWTNDVGTIYGGYVDLVSGELVATHIAFVMDGITHKVTQGGNINSNNMARAHSFIGRTGIEDLPLGKNNKGLYAINKYVKHGMDNGSGDSAVEGVYCGTGTPYVRVVTSADNLSDISSTSTTVTSINDWLSQNPIQICYELAEPITYQLTPEQLVTLKGQNNISADTNGAIDAKYWKH